MRARENKLAATCAALLILAGLAFAQDLGAGRLTEQEKRGKQIYLLGTSPSGKDITCFLNGTEVPATAMLCVNCHGFDGRGNPEGGVTPSDITWEAMTKSYGVTHASGRKHPPYTERALDLAIARGVDPAGSTIPQTMPRYWLSREDMADLLAYLKRLGNEREPGLSEATIRIGTIVPDRGPLAETGEAINAALSASFSEINAQGGIYNRKVELRVCRPPADPKAARASVEAFIDREEIFALVGAFIAGADKELVSLVEEKQVPLIGPATLYPETSFPINRHTFYILSGLKEQTRALINFAGRRIEKQILRIAIVYGSGESSAQVAKAIEQQTGGRSYSLVAAYSYLPGSFDARRAVAEVNKKETDAVLFLGTGSEAAALMKEAERVNWTPTVLIPGSLVGKEILEAPPVFKGKIFLSYPTLPSDLTRHEMNQFRALAEKYNLPAGHRATQFSTLCAARILLEAVKLAGKDLTREKVIRELEGFYEFDTGLVPPITFGPNRRIGALGAYIVTIDLEKKELIPASGWIMPD
jgi:ABC-type branched-subunit amino acid transport system substrate-binding protein